MICVRLSRLEKCCSKLVSHSSVTIDQADDAAKDTGIAALDARLMQSTVESAVAMARKNRVAGGSFNIDEFLIR